MLVRNLTDPIPILDGQFTLDPQTILQVLHCEKGDIVSLSGTLIEGIGNRHSDIDVNVFTTRRRRFDPERHGLHAFVHRPDMTMCTSSQEEVFMTMDYYPGSAFHLDVEYWTFDDFEEILERVRNTYFSLLQHSDVNYTQDSLSPLEQLVLTRTICGVTIFGDPAWAERKTRVTASQYAYTLYRGFANNYWRFKDICGALEVGRNIMARDLAQMFLMDEIRAALHLNGVVNATRKWFSVYWAQLRENGYAEVHDKTLKLLFAADTLDAQRYVEEVLAAVDAVEAVNRSIMDAHDVLPSAADQLRLMEREIEQRSSKIDSKVQEHEFLFRRRTFEPTNHSYADLLRFL